MRRDRVTFAMMIGIPIMQLLLFGYAINTDPRHLPTLVEMNDSGPVTRSILASMESSTFFDFQGVVSGREDGDRALRDGTRKLRRRDPSGIRARRGAWAGAPRSCWPPTPPTPPPPAARSRRCRRHRRQRHRRAR